MTPTKTPIVVPRPLADAVSRCVKADSLTCAEAASWILRNSHRSLQTGEIHRFLRSSFTYETVKSTLTKNAHFFVKDPSGGWTNRIGSRCSVSKANGLRKLIPEVRLAVEKAVTPKPVPKPKPRPKPVTVSKAGGRASPARKPKPEPKAPHVVERAAIATPSQDRVLKAIADLERVVRDPQTRITAVTLDDSSNRRLDELAKRFETSAAGLLEFMRSESDLMRRAIADAVLNANMLQQLRSEPADATKAIRGPQSLEAGPALQLV